MFSSRVLTTLHSRLTKHSATSGGVTASAGTAVSPNAANLSTSRPEQLPILTTCSANSTAGTAITHWRVARRAAKL